VAELPSHSIRLRAPVERVRSASAGFRVDVADGESLDAVGVVLATPGFVTAQVARDLDPQLARLCGDIEYASTATIALAFSREQVAHPLNGSGFVVPRVEGRGILAASWLSSKWPHRAPEGRVLMRAFAGGMRDPHATSLSDKELVDRSMVALAPLLGISGAPLLTRVYRWERASAQHNVGHLARLAAIDQRLAEHPGLFVTGSGFRGVGIPDCVSDGRATAVQAASWLPTAHAAAGATA
jgi:oxygen-dependent protoporphyrinogen oxidase